MTRSRFRFFAAAPLWALLAVLLWASPAPGAGAGHPGFLPLEPQAKEAGDSQGPAFLPGTPPPQPARTPPEDQAAALERRGIVPVELKPARPRVLAAPFSATLAHLHVHDGEIVDEGRPLAAFDTAAISRDAEKIREDMRDGLRRVQEKSDDSGRARASESLALLADRLRQNEGLLAGAELRAPFKGRVTQVFAKAGQYVRLGEAVLEMAEEGDLEIVCSIPSNWLSRLETGSLIWVYVDETARSYEAEILRFGGRVDRQSRSVKAYAAFREARPELLPGMGGRADFFPKPAAR